MWYNPLHLSVGMLYWVVTGILIFIYVDGICQSSIWRFLHCYQFIARACKDFRFASDRRRGSHGGMARYLQPRSWCSTCTYPLGGADLGRSGFIAFAAFWLHSGIALYQYQNVFYCWPNWLLWLTMKPELSPNGMRAYVKKGILSRVKTCRDACISFVFRLTRVQ